MPAALETALVTVLIIAAAVWVGGYVTVIVVSVTSAKVLRGEARVQFFRRFGATYLAVALPSLLVTYVLGWTLLAREPWSTELTRMAVASVLLVVALAAGVMQARGLTRLRERAVTDPQDARLAEVIRRRARSAAVLRGLIGLLTLGLTIHAAGVLTAA